jgi:AcrR family transcriptional regulator
MAPDRRAQETPRRRGRPATIDRARIVSAALAIAAEEGASAVTMSSVARRLGVGMPALYHHIRNVDDLLGLVATALLRDLQIPDVRMRWDRWLVAFADSFRAALIDEPLLTRIPSLSVHQPFPVHTVERGLRVLVRGGFDELTAALVFGEFVRKVVDLVFAQQARAAETKSGHSPLRVMRAGADRVAEAEIPTLSAVLEALSPVEEDPDRVSEFLWDWNLRLEILGLRALLDEGRPSFGI